MTAAAHLGGFHARGLLDVTADPEALDSVGWWAVLATFEGDITCARFERVKRSSMWSHAGWRGPASDAWSTSMHRSRYLDAVESVRERIARGDVYQVNVCRVMEARLPDPLQGDVAGLAALLSEGNPSPYGGFLRLPEDAHPALPPGGIHVASASPEQFLRRDGAVLESSPIKGTGRTRADLLPKDEAENVMIVDLVRNDLSPLCATGSVEVPSLLRVEEHPGLVHLVSTVRGSLNPGVGWPEILDSTFPPGSVSGAPKSAALRAISEVESVARGPYCGAIGWVDADRRAGELAVGIRTFWLSGAATAGDLHPSLRFGTGAGITWGSDAAGEWDETELKAARLVALACGEVEPDEISDDPEGRVDRMAR